MRIVYGIWLLAALLLSGCGSTLVASPGTGAESQVMREQPERLIVVAVANPKEAVATQAGSTLSGYAASQRYAAGSFARATLESLKRDYALSELAAWPITALRLHCVVLEIAPGASRDAVLAALAKDARVEIAQPLQSFDTLSANAGGYNDPYVELQRGFVEIGAAEAHRMSRGKGVRIAVIDTGVDTTHPDLRGRIATTRNLVDRDEAQFNSDRHGTEVAGVIAAIANNGQGIVGIAPEAELTVYKACWQRQESDAGARCNSFTLAQALAASLEAGSHVINLSLGGPPDELLGRLVAQALKRGSIVVGAMPADGRLWGFPAGVPGVIVVDTVGRSDAGRVLYAPGRDILTLEPGGHYDFESGSSIAAAHVSAAVALLLSADPKLDAAAVRTLLQRSKAPAAAGASIDACAALARLRPAATCTSHREPSQGADLSKAVSSR